MNTNKIRYFLLYSYILFSIIIIVLVIDQVCQPYVLLDANNLHFQKDIIAMYKENNSILTDHLNKIARKNTLYSYFYCSYIVVNIYLFIVGFCKKVR